MKCISSIHRSMMQNTQQLLHAGLQPGHLEDRDLQTAGRSSIATQDSPHLSHTHYNEPSTFNILMEKVLKLNENLSQKASLPYIGPRTYLQFLECFCEIFHRKRASVVADRANLSKALAVIHGTKDQTEETKNILQELRQQHDKTSKLSEQILKSLTQKSCQVEELKALLGHSSSVLSAMQMVNEQERQLLENEEDDEELLVLSMDKQTTRLETLLSKSKDRLRLAELEESKAKQSLTKFKERVHHWHSKIDRNAIDQIKGLNNPPPLVGTIMELMLTLLQQEQETSSNHEENPSMHVLDQGMLKKKKSITKLTAKENWNSIQIAIGDSQNFLDLLNGLKWEDGLSTDAVNLIVSKLAIPGKNVPLESKDESHSGSISAHESKGNLITFSMAHYATESVANMCAFAVAIVEYDDNFKIYKHAAEKLLQ